MIFEKIESIDEDAYFAQIKEEKRAIVNCVDRILKEGDFDSALLLIESKFKSSEWLRQAYRSYYRGNIEIKLDRADSLDYHNIEILRLIINLRRMPNWSDWRLYELEDKAKA